VFYLRIMSGVFCEGALKHLVGICAFDIGCCFYLAEGHSPRPSMKPSYAMRTNAGRRPATTSQCTPNALPGITRTYPVQSRSERTQCVLSGCLVLPIRTRASTRRSFLRSQRPGHGLIMSSGADWLIRAAPSGNPAQASSSLGESSPSRRLLVTCKSIGGYLQFKLGL
jgi:hypothetical protein